MLSRKPGYLIGAILLAIVTTAPQIVMGGAVGLACYYMGGRWPLPTLPGMGVGQNVFNSWSNVSLWHDQFVFVQQKTETANKTVEFSISLRDPDSDEKSTFEVTLPGGRFFQTLTVGDRLLFTNDIQTFEVVDGAPKISPHFPIPRGRRDSDRFIWKGEPAFVQRTASGFTVSDIQNDAWTPIGSIKFPDFSIARSFGGSTTRIQLAPLSGTKSSIQVLNSENEIHLFLQNDGRLLYHKGLELDGEQSTIPIPTVVNNDPGNATVKTVGHHDDQEHAQNDADQGDDLAGWSLVREAPVSGIKGIEFTHGLLIEGQPAALIVDDAASGHSIGHLFRFDGTTWNETASIPFPFGASHFRTITSHNGQRSYAVVTTTNQLVHFYEIEAAGLRKINSMDRPHNSALIALTFNGAIPAITLVLGIVLGIGILILMRWYTKPDYEFGVQMVTLASIGWRGVARLIDLGLIGVSTVAIGALLSLGFDWLAFAEALNLHVDHPTVRVAVRNAVILAAWLVTIVSAMLVMQAAWGITPGKWLCRLRTVRTSLRPCGFARSLARELVFFLDCGNFLCWTPGIISIAMTDRRQRLGDFVADTIVVNARSLNAA